ncbi:MAG: response regulator [Chitinophagaceae bacterium]
MIKIALVDDHALLRNGLASLINSFDGFKVIFEADNGKQMIDKFAQGQQPDLVLMDINMPEMDGFQSTLWLKDNQPQVKVLVLSMLDNDTAIIRMLRYGAKGYILKDSRPEIFKDAINSIIQKGFYMNELVTGRLVHLVHMDSNTTLVQLTDKEIEFLKQCCSEKSYKEIAVAMNITPRAVEALRANVFEKIDTSNRVGAVLYAIKNGIVVL